MSTKASVYLSVTICRLGHVTAAPNYASKSNRRPRQNRMHHRTLLGVLCLQMQSRRLMLCLVMRVVVWSQGGRASVGDAAPSTTTATNVMC